MTRYSLLACLTLGMGLVGPAYAQGEQDEVIVVSGQGLEQTPAITAYSVRELEREEIVATGSGRIEDALSSVAGFQQFRRSDSRSSNPSAQGATLRALGGNATSRALVLLDGVPMADPFFGYIPFSALAPERLQSIRVTRGGGSGPFGAGALAGTIELDSARAGTLGLVSGSTLINDRGGTEASATIAPELGAGYAIASARWDRGPGFYTTPASQRDPATARAAYDSWSVSLRGVAPLSQTVELQASGLIFDDDRTLRFVGAENGSRGQDASLRVVGRGEWQFDLIGYVQSRNFDNVVISSTRFVRVLDQRNTPSTGIGGKFELRPPVGEGQTVRLGLDYRRASGELQEEAYSAFSGNLTERRRAGGRNTDLGLFAESDWQFGALVLTGGLRADHTQIDNGFFISRNAAGVIVDQTIAPDRSDWTLSWRAGAAWQPNDAVRLRGAAYRGLRLPTLNELYRPFVVFPVVTQANAALENEILEGFEAGLHITPSAGVTLSATAFDNRVNNAIANVTIGPDLRQRQNLPAIDAQGIELGARVERGQLSFDGTLAYTDATVDGRGTSLSLDGKRPPQTPRWAASATLAWQPAAGWRLATTLRHVGTQYESDQQTDRLPPATTLDAFASVPVGQGFALILRGENLFDETIVTRNSGGSIDLGTPRTVWAGLRYGF